MSGHKLNLNDTLRIVPDDIPEPRKQMPKPTKAHQDKTKYSRKCKHKVLTFKDLGAM